MTIDMASCVGAAGRHRFPAVRCAVRVVSESLSHRPQQWRHVHGVLLVLLLFSHCLQSTVSCPRDCFCEPHSNNVQCTGKGLSSIPESIPRDTMELIMNQNTFLNPELSRENFTNLVKLQKLYMSRCGIESIVTDTFMDLTDLIWLDISNNKISVIRDFTFRGLHLKHLFINDNSGVQLSSKAFEGMNTQGLYMHNSGLSGLSVQVMAPLNGTLRTLWLYENELESLPEDWLYFFNNLGHIRLGKNPFHCNCEIGWLHKFFKKHNSVFSGGGDLPTCASPAPVRNKRFGNLTVDDFRCDLPTFRNVDAVFERQTGKLTCLAGGDPTPTVYWIRPDGTSEKFSPANEDVEQNEGVLYMAHVKLTNSTRYKCVASNPAGNVTFSLNVVWPVLPASRPDDSTLVTGPKPQAPPQQLNDEAQTGDRHSVEWQVNRAEHKANSKVEGAEGVKQSHDHVFRFSIQDVVGAVVGTFFITLIMCSLVAHLCWRRRLRLRQKDAHSVVSCNPPLGHQTRLYIMNDDGDNCLHMLNHFGQADYPS